ncbi:hypothetical protein cypCar_00050120 [Cyprinus carpio]|nr:hypothetical protein cypCar_00050120 [Cyprinus carpio]
MKLLKDVDEEGVDIRVVSMLDSSSQPMPTKSATYGGLPKTYSMICLAHDEDDKKSHKVAKKPSFLSWGLKNKQKSGSTLSLPSADYNGPWNRPCPTYRNSYNESALY